MKDKQVHCADLVHELCALLSYAVYFTNANLIAEKSSYKLSAIANFRYDVSRYCIYPSLRSFRKASNRWHTDNLNV